MRIDPGPELEFGADGYGLVDRQFAVVAQVGQSCRRFLIKSHLVLQSSRRLLHDPRHPRAVRAADEIINIIIYLFRINKISEKKKKH